MANDKRPVIEIGGEIYEAERLKARVWLEYVNIEEKRAANGAEKLIETSAELIALVFGEEVTADKILDEMYLDEILPLANECAAWVSGSIGAKLERINNEYAKNADAGDGAEN